MSLQITWISNLKNVLKALQKMKEPFWYLTQGFSAGMSNLVYEFRDQKIKEYLEMLL
jgi:hypothetical protein